MNPRQPSCNKVAGDVPRGRVDQETARLAPHEGRLGRPPVFFDAAIQFCLSIEVLFELPLRQTAGMVASLLRLAGLNGSVPDFGTLCRRQKTLAVQIPYRRVDGPPGPLVPSRDITARCPAGQRTAPASRSSAMANGRPGWNGPQGRRQWRKVHPAMDTATSDIRAVEFTPGSDGPSRGLHANHCRAVDGPILPELLGQIPEDEQIGTVTADGAYDTRRCHGALIDRQATPIVPIRENGRPWKEDCPAAKARNETLRAAKHYGRASWKHWTGYRARSRVEAKTRCLEAFGERIAERDPDRQTAEIHIRAAPMNRFSALGTAEIVRAARHRPGKGASRPRREFRNNACLMQKIK